MSLENSFSKIKRNTGIKKCLIIDGNIGDVYLSNKSTRAKIVTLREYLEDMLKELDYREIVLKNLLILPLYKSTNLSQIYQNC